MYDITYSRLLVNQQHVRLGVLYGIQSIYNRDGLYASGLALDLVDYDDHDYGTRHRDLDYLIKQ